MKGSIDRLFCPLLERPGPLICGRRLDLSGWALLAGGVREVRVAVGDREQAADLERGGVLEITTPNGDEQAVKFSTEIDLVGLAEGDHAVTVTASGPAGQIHREGTVHVLPYLPVEGDAIAPALEGCPTLALDEGPKCWPVADIAGWLWPATGLRAITFVLDRRHRYAIAPNRLIHRTDVTQALEAAGVQSEGRNGLLLKLDVRGQPAGAQHVLVICAWEDGTVLGAEGVVHVDYAPDWTPAAGIRPGDMDRPPPAWAGGTDPPSVPDYQVDGGRMRDRAVQAEALVRELRLNHEGERSRVRLAEIERDAALARLAELEREA